MSFQQQFTVAFFKIVTRLICRIDQKELQKVPGQGPLIIVANHINVLEIPVLYTCMRPRRVHGMVLAERWKNPVLGFILDAGESIPVKRGEPDLAAIRQALAYLDQGHQLLIMPEGTRSGDGRLQAGYPGVVLLAQHTHAPLLPVVSFGGERYKENLARLKRTDFHIRVGKPFCLDAKGKSLGKQGRAQMIDEVMYQLAALLPPEYRGVYANLSQATQEFISWLPDHPVAQKSL